MKYTLGLPDHDMVRVGAALLLGTSLAIARAAPTLGPADPASAAGPGSLDSVPGSAVRGEVSTGHRSLDLLLDARMPAQGASAATGTSRTAAPAIREADLKQALRAEAALQAASRTPMRPEARELLGGDGRSLQEDEQSADPSLRRRWGGGGQAAEPGQHSPKVSAEESALVQTLREIASFLRAHRVELFAGLGLLVVVGVLVKLRSHSR